jgi:hypothetical protein
LAAFVLMAASELDLTEQIPRHPIDSVKLALLSAIRTRVRILHEPVSFAVTAKRLLAILALDGVLQDVVADAAD